MQKHRLVETLVMGGDQLSRSITSATWLAMLDDDRRAGYESIRAIADQHGVDRIRPGTGKYSRYGAAEKP
jgi:two-component system, NtrC family, sensor kinase